MPSAARLHAACQALGLRFYFGPRRGESESFPSSSTPTLDRFSASIDMTVRGWATCSIEGYLEGEKEFPELPMPLGLEDEDAFYAIALGASMRSEGIENGDYCVVSPNTPLAAGLRVWLKNQRDQVTIKRLLAETETHYELLGWQDPDAKGEQAPYHDQWLKSFVKAKGVVLAVYRGRPNVKNPPPLIPDSKAPPAQPKGARALEAAGAVGQRFTDEALREEIHTLRDTTIAMRGETQALREEIARREAATETALKELTSQLSRTAPKKLEDDSALAEPDSGKVLEFPEPDPDAEICGLPYRVNIGGAAGPGAFVDDENVIKLIGFRRDWLRKHGINPDKCSLIDVRGDSMEPELRDKAIILIDHQRTRRLAGRIFVVRSDDGLQIKRLKHDNHDWLLVSDNDEEYPPVRWPEEAVVIGQVIWTGRTL